MARANLESNDLPLFFAKNVSVLPPRAPESPALFPLCFTITAIRARHTSRLIMVNAIFKIINPFISMRKALKTC